MELQQHSLRSVLSIDPGRNKVGVAVVRSDGQVLFRAVLSLDELHTELQSLFQRFLPQCLVMGGGTGLSHVQSLVQRALPSITITIIDEAFTSEQARKRYLQENPPRGWRRLIPSWLRFPDKPYDDYVAIILAERYWQEYTDKERTE